jgi:exodeoxyribonuclease V, alpha subunit
VPSDFLASSPTHDLAQGFAQQAQQWALEAGASPEDAALAARAALALSLAASEGHVCLQLDELAEAATLRAGLQASRIVGTPQAPGAMPLILDGERLYLHRHFDLERRLARRLVQAARAVDDTPVAPRARALLHELFADDTHRDGEADWQQLAAALALRRRLLVVSGGPGTGKTTTVVKLLACLLAQAPHSHIALAAPTGKAAARLAAAMREHGPRLPPDLRARLPTQAWTVHRLLGGHGGRGGGFRHHAGHLLPIDVLVVDEASMLDLALAARLLEAVPASARIVLLGDKDQLAAVEAGQVFAEVAADPRLSPACIRELATLCGLEPAAIAAPPAASQRTGLADSVVWLRRNFRFGADSPLGRLARAVNAGHAVEALALLHEARAPATALQPPSTAPAATDGAPPGSLRWLPEGQPALSPAAQQCLLAGFAPYFEALRRDPRDVDAATTAFNRFRVLAALREGERGVAMLDELVASHARRVVNAAPNAPWYPGRAVLVTRNDEGLQLFNGDVGIVLPAADGTLRVMFPSASGPRAVAPARLPPHQGAFALSVHRAQGSEFEEVLLVLPAQASRVLSRELLHTGLTRARSRVTLVGSAAAIEGAIATPTRRNSGLSARLREEFGP